MRASRLWTYLLGLQSFFGGTVFGAATARHPCEELVVDWFLDTKPNNDATAPATVYQKCLRSIPFDQEKAKIMVNSINMLNSHNTLVAYMRPDSGGDFLSHLELKPFIFRDAFLELYQKVEISSGGWGFTTNIHFWNAVAELFERFKDYHVAYEPYCARGLADYVHDYPIVAVGDSADGGRDIYTFKNQPPGKHSTGLIKLDRKVVAINDKDPIQYLLELVQRAPDLEDPDARWNTLMAQYPATNEVGWFAKRKFWDEKLDKLILRFENDPKPVDVEWSVTVSDWDSKKDAHKFIQNHVDFANAFCYTIPTNPYPLQNSTSSSMIPEKSEIVGDGTNGAPVKIKRLPRISAANIPTPLPDGILELSNDGKKTLLLALSTLNISNIGPVGIMRVPTFVLDNGSVNEQQTEEYKSFVKNIADKLYSAGVKKLIIDVSSNGGGDRDLIDILFTSMFPTKDHAIGTSTFGQRSWSRGADALFKYNNAHYNDSKRPGSNSNWEVFLDPATGKKFDKMEDLVRWEIHHKAYWFHTISSASRNNSVYSDPEIVFPKFPLKAEDMVVVTNGYCGSCCARFVNLLTHPNNGVRAYTYGGRPNRSKMQAVGGTQGELVLELEDFHKEANKVYQREYRNNREWVPELPWGTKLVQARINAENSFYKGMEKDLVPLQYRFRPACKKLPLTKNMIGSMVGIYELVGKVAWVDRTLCEPQPDWVKKSSAGEVKSENVNDWETELRK
ncbi:hypothetical protein EX30DRAFT_395869 [Ascodesmis nigricans]|uniref:CPAF-like PDZ domain-containing protein n=1 Tax=Ascodesmis nigricans TaxID=341454 RepID=A0A4S2MWX3_9PEZI|nr:hypothetical protein EX30DRAFT_395869 [Ascodesmis nigricans]